ncbi:lipid-A-disaccharide synthase N-terminal domain-containing protein [Dyella sp. ASV21]|uniref:lipid-A-disaccharide synthase N-terminal domain-containing protein n=1 Tax=Dyella sp. ASV21 TaxID=2795114 RepID=UPI0018ECCA23|nr:lipid-A-disaccharide synthase N-terminal domain-containing protein [Dyella sp. ASV21]
MNNTSTAWVIIGMIGQIIFSARFLLQWIHSEHRRESSIPCLLYTSPSPRDP